MNIIYLRIKIISDHIHSTCTTLDPPMDYAENKDFLFVVLFFTQFDEH